MQRPGDGKRGAVVGCFGSDFNIVARL